MKIEQISVFLENRKGRLLDVCSLLGKHAINIRALTIAETQDFGILRLVVDKTKEAVSVFKEHNFTVHITDIVAVEVDDQPGGLANILKSLSTHNINIEYMYGFVEKFSEKALLVFRFDDPDKAIEVLKKAGINVIQNKDIAHL